ncbi:MAG: type III-B CRISPR module RAMP protein Cmr4 [Caldilinea sp.]
MDQQEQTSAELIATPLYLYAETPLHAGVGFVGDGPVDLPIQREAATGYPVVRSSTLKGTLRAAFRDVAASEEVIALFGSEPTAAGNAGQDEAQEKAAEQMGSLVIGDAQLLLFPVAALLDSFAWITSADILARFQREVQRRGVDLKAPTVPAPGEGSAWTPPQSRLVTEQGELVLEEFTFQARPHEAMGTIGAWFAKVIFPQDDAYAYWRQRVRSNLVILPEEAFRHFITTGTEVVQRIRIDPATGIAQAGALWSEEYVPAETLFYAMIGARAPILSLPALHTGKDVLALLQAKVGGYLSVGGGRNLDRGAMRLRWAKEFTP